MPFLRLKQTVRDPNLAIVRSKKVSSSQGMAHSSYGFYHSNNRSATRDDSLSPQVNTLIKGLEKIAASCEIPMIVTGDFNSPPGSAAHDLLTKQSVRDEHKVGSNTPCGS